MSPAKKLFLILFVLILGVIVLLSRQISRTVSITTTPSNQPLLSPVTTDIPINLTDPIFGNPGAPLTLTVFMDIGSAASRELHTTLVAFIQKHPEQVQLIWKDAPEQSLFFKDTMLAHQAAACAKAQNKFWPYTETLMTEKKYRSLNDLRDAAQKNNLVMTTWETCFSNPATAEKMTTNRLLARQLGITSTPVLFVNNKRLTLTKDIDINQLLEAFIAP